MEQKWNSVTSGNLINHWSMNWARFKDPICFLCLAGTVVASWPLKQQMAGSNNLFKIQYFFSLNLANSVKTYKKNSIVSDQDLILVRCSNATVSMKAIEWKNKNGNRSREFTGGVQKTWNLCYLLPLIFFSGLREALPFRLLPWSSSERNKDIS